ncbi:MAG: hypothetical protein PT119_15260, partial [Aphanizomenon gracile PMC627.10]|nr:hypothetical protein [Aphanizomenon gracile PMC627.10]
MVPRLLVALASNKLDFSNTLLVIQPEEKIENRVYIIVNYLAKTYLESQWLITEIDATGLLGNRLTS